MNFSDSSNSSDSFGSSGEGGEGGEGLDIVIGDPISAVLSSLSGLVLLLQSPEVSLLHIFSSLNIDDNSSEKIYKVTNIKNVKKKTYFFILDVDKGFCGCVVGVRRDSFVESS